MSSLKVTHIGFNPVSTQTSVIFCGTISVVIHYIAKSRPGNKRSRKEFMKKHMDCARKKNTCHFESNAIINEVLWMQKYLL